MKNKTLNTIKYGIMAIAIVLAGLQVAVKAQSDAERSLEGVWTTRNTPRNCAHRRSDSRGSRKGYIVRLPFPFLTLA